jgi:hypothetical protein
LQSITSTECSIAHYFNRKIGVEKLLQRGIKSMEIGIAEANNQMASYRAPIPQSSEELYSIETAPLMIAPKPCLSDD